MGQMNRRDFIQAFAVASLLSGCSPKPMGRTPLAANSTKNVVAGLKTVNVLIHGTFACIFRTGQSLILLTPNVGADHKYAAGQWKSEQTLRQKATETIYALTGVNNGILQSLQGHPITQSMAVIPEVIPGGSQVQADPRDLTFFTVILPLPDNVVPANCVARADGQPIFDMTFPQGLTNPTQIGLTPVFVYNSFYDTPTFVCYSELEQPLWTASPDANGFANLHIRAEPITIPPNPTPAHFRDMLGLLPPLPNFININSSPNSVAKLCPVPGIAQGEDQGLLSLQKLGLLSPSETALLGLKTLPGSGPSSSFDLTNCQSVVVTFP